MIEIQPVLHDRLELADLVRARFDAFRPDAVVVELPSSCADAWLKAVRRLPAVSVLLFETRGGETVYLPVHPADPFAEAARRALEAGAEVRCGDLDIDGYADYRDPIPDPYALTRIGAETYVDAVRAAPRPRDPFDDRREASLAFHARAAEADGRERVLVVCGIHHADGVRAQLDRPQAQPLARPARTDARIVHLHPDCLGEVLPEIPFDVAVYEARRRGLPDPPPETAPASSARDYGPFRVLDGGGRDHDDDDAARLRATVARAARGCGAPETLDRLRCRQALLRAAEDALRRTAPDEDVRAWQRRNLARYGRNLALRSGALVPDLFDLVVAARGCVSENFATEVLRLARAYPDQAEVATDAPTARIRAEEMYDGTRRIRLRPRVRRPKRGDWSRLLRRRKHERYPGEWLEGFDSTMLCSYPPEDIVIEEFGRYLQKRGKQVLSDERSRTVPFTTSVLDGIDVRETIRNWSEGRIYVREQGRVPGQVGSVVVLFDADEERYPYDQTWLGEHDQESDMAFFCTDPAQGIVGPGISRVTYGGLMLSHPPRRMADVWTDPDYRIAETKGEVLLLAALDYSTEDLVVHVAARPPRSLYRRLAARLGMKILHLPLGTLSPSTVKKIRVMHILSGHDKREIAREYLW